jgi:hypothetical protein
MNIKDVIAGGCACGAVRFTAKGKPSRAGLCHCMTCRKAHASAFNPFVVFPSASVTVTGELKRWRSSADYERLFCPHCGSRVIGRDLASGEVEISLGSFDDASRVQPEYECWTGTREAWLHPREVPQYTRDRSDAN